MHPVRIILIVLILAGSSAALWSARGIRQPNVPVPPHMTPAEATAALGGRTIATDALAALKALLP